MHNSGKTAADSRTPAFGSVPENLKIYLMGLYQIYYFFKKNMQLVIPANILLFLSSHLSDEHFPLPVSTYNTN